MSKTLAYYPGCSLHGTSGEFDASFKATARALGLTWPEIPGWECCGNTAAHSINRLLAAALPVNELAKVEQDMKLDAVAVPCAACYSRFKTGAHEVEENEQTASDVRAVVGRAYNGGVEVQNLIDIYHDAVGLEELAAKVTRPFGGLKIASYYGCLLTRPPKVTLADDPEYPTHMDEVVKAIGCDAGRLELQDRLLRRLAGAHRAGNRRRPGEPHPHRRQGLRRRRRLRRLPVVPGEPRRPPERDHAHRQSLAAHPGGLPQPARRPRPRPRRQGAGAQEAPHRHHGGDGVGACRALTPGAAGRHSSQAPEGAPRGAPSS